VVRLFHELLYARGDTPVRELIAALDGCSGAKAGEIIAEAQLGRALCKDITRPQAAKLLAAAQDNARPVKPQRLGAVGQEAFPSLAYTVAYGSSKFGAAEPYADIPFVVEAWVGKREDREVTALFAYVNRTPVSGSIKAARNKREINAFGCGLHHTIAKSPADVQFDIWLNITAPCVPITSDGKAPDLKPFRNEIATVVEKAIKKAYRPSAKGNSQKDIVLDNLEAVIATVSDAGEFRFNARQLFYALRPIVKDELDRTLEIENFTKIITDYEAEFGEIKGMYREPRGSIYHPHRGKTITLGTLMVEDYNRPAWTFNKLLYIEKEGFSEALKDIGWPERHDCAVMSSKGFSTRAARDLIDKLAEHDEPVTVFCVHDADAYGTMIYQTLQQETAARGARKINIVNLGLEPWEAIEMDLEVEDVEEGGRRKAVAGYVGERDDDEEWSEWLQTHRVELNAMTTPQFIEWLDDKMADYDKLIPPHEVLEMEWSELIESKTRAAITERILREAGLGDQVAAAIAAIEKPSAEELEEGVASSFEQEPDGEWRDYIEDLANEKVFGGGQPDPATT
jgi:hypothetical protein